MATVNQIYALVNDSVAEALGAEAIEVKDTASFVTAASKVLSSDSYMDAYIGALVDRIGRTAIAIRAVKKKRRYIKRDQLDWGAVYQKISFKTSSASKNTAWDPEHPGNPFTVVSQGGVVQALFTVLSTYHYEDRIPHFQLRTAFTNAETMGAFISGIYQRMDNDFTRAENALADEAVATNIAGVLIKGGKPQKRNLLGEFITLSGKTYTTIDDAHMDADYLKYATREIREATGNLQEDSVIYNISSDIPRNTPSDKMVVEVLNKFASAVSSYLESDTYHNEMVALPGYEEVRYWQAPGTSFAFEDVSKINIKNADLKVTGNSTGSCEQGGIIAFIHDEDSCACIMNYVRDHSIPDDYNESTIITKNADPAFLVDLTENAIVFYEELPVTPDEPGEGGE